MLLKHWNVSPDSLVVQSLSGLVAATPLLRLLSTPRVVTRLPELQDDSTVTVVSGGGSGHEPLHAGMVGLNLLDVAVAGNVFALPLTKQIYAGILAAPSKKGTLVIVKNYTGDILHFGLAAERAQSDPRVEGGVELVVVDDDVAVGRAKGGLVGRRGLAGTILAHKIAGGASAEGQSLEAVAKLVRLAIAQTVTIGALLDRCSVPGRDVKEEAEAALALDEVEIGLGIHNEPGVKRVSPIPSLDELVASLLTYLVDQQDKDRAYVEFGADDEVVLVVNDLGGTSNLELYAVVDAVVRVLASKHAIKPVRIYVGDFVTLLNAPGFSITLLNASKVEAGASKVLGLLDLPTDAPGWKIKPYKHSAPAIEDGSEDEPPVPTSKLTSTAIYPVLAKGLEVLLAAEPKITRYDTIAGDGDCGETLAAGAHALQKAMASKHISETDPVAALATITNLVEEAMGGTSGGLYLIFLSAWVKALALSGESGEVTQKVLAATANQAYADLCKYTNARPGDRTLMDALGPFVEKWKESGDVVAALEAAWSGSEGTRELVAKFGRASYVGQEEFDKEGGIPDPGALGVASLVKGFVEGWKQ